MPFADPLLITGRTRSHLVEPEPGNELEVPIHIGVLDSFQELRTLSLAAGFDLQILSGFRSFEDQLSIWNRKASGQLAVLDSFAKPLDIQKLSPREVTFAILRWSALPGASRHHWGTDLDVFDAASMPPGYKIELIPEEVNSGGMFGPFHDWLDKMIMEDRSCGFFRPYDRDRGGVSPERWHLSFAPVAQACLETLTLDLLKQTLEESDIALKSCIMDNLEEIYTRFVININKEFRHEYPTT